MPKIDIANGIDQDALDAAAESGFANGAFENTAVEMIDIAEEFLLGDGDQSEVEADKRNKSKVGLANKLQDKLDQKASSQGNDSEAGGAA